MSHSTEGTLERQWKLLKLLPSRGSGLTAKQITERYAHSNSVELTNTADTTYKSLKRKIQRDLETLAAAGLVEKNDKGKPYGWHLPADSRLLASQTPAEALFLNLAERAIEPLVPRSLLEPLAPAFEQARTIVNSDRPGKSRLSDKLISVRSQPLHPACVEEGILELVYEALEKGRMLEVRYQRPLSTESRTYQLHPHGLLQRPPSVYLLASVGDYDDVLHFALHRIEEARLMTLTVRQRDLDLMQLEKNGNLNFGNRGLIELKLLTNFLLAQLLAETPLAGNQTIEQQSEDVYVITATVNDSWDLLFWLLSQGGNLEVVAPESLRERVREELEAALEQYHG